MRDFRRGQQACCVNRDCFLINRAIAALRDAHSAFRS